MFLDRWEVVGGSRLSQRLQEGLAGSTVVVLVVSRAAVTKEWWHEEFAAAIAGVVAGTQRLIPVLLDDVPLPPFVANRLYADFRHLDAPAQYEARFAELLKAVQGVPVGERPQRDHQAALTIHEELGDRAGIAASYHQLGALRTEQGRSADGVPYCIRSLAIQFVLQSPEISPNLFWLAGSGRR